MSTPDLIFNVVPGNLVPGVSHLAAPLTPGDGKMRDAENEVGCGAIHKRQTRNSVSLVCNRPRSIYQYSNKAPRLSGQTFIVGVVFFVLKSLLGIERPESLGAMLKY